MMLLATATFSTLALDQLFDHAPTNLLTRGNGVVLLLLFGVFLYYTISRIVLKKVKVQSDPFLDVLQQKEERKRPLSTKVSLMLTFVGLVALVVGGRITVHAAVNIAVAFGVPEFIIGITIISFGTTLPELVTGMLATRRGEGDIAIGNVVGSNIFNLLFIGGTVSVIAPVRLPPRAEYDLLLLIALSILVLPISVRGNRTVTRSEGAFLFCVYLSYLLWRTVGLRGS